MAFSRKLWYRIVNVQGLITSQSCVVKQFCSPRYCPDAKANAKPSSAPSTSNDTKQNTKFSDPRMYKTLALGTINLGIVTKVPPKTKENHRVASASSSESQISGGTRASSLTRLSGSIWLLVKSCELPSGTLCGMRIGDESPMLSKTMLLDE